MRCDPPAEDSGKHALTDAHRTGEPGRRSAEALIANELEPAGDVGLFE